MTGALADCGAERDGDEACCLGTRTFNFVLDRELSKVPDFRFPFEFFCFDDAMSWLSLTMEGELFNEPLGVSLGSWAC
jgi:hypothetical protein